MLKNPCHAGGILREDVLPHFGLSPEQAATVLNESPASFALILAGRRPISAALADRIEAAFGVSAELLVNMQRTFDEARRQRPPSRPTIAVLAVLALAGLAWQAIDLVRRLL